MEEYSFDFELSVSIQELLDLDDKISSAEITLESAKMRLATVETECELAELFAQVDAKASVEEDAVYDFAENAEECKLAEASAGEWFILRDNVKDKILAILRSEGVTIPKTRQIVVLEVFMKRNGYRNHSGWWIKREE